MTHKNNDSTNNTHFHKIFDREISDGDLDARLLAPFASQEATVVLSLKIVNIISVLDIDTYIFMKTIEEALERTLDIVRNSKEEPEERLLSSLEALSEQILHQVDAIRYDFQSPPKEAPVLYKGATVDGDPHAFLSKHWSGWISNKLVTIEKLKELDRPLWLALRNKSQRDPTYPKPKDIFPSTKEYMHKLEELT